MNIGHWNCEREFDVNEKLGFVYCVSNLKDGRRYLGRKQFWSKHTTRARYKTGRAYKKREWVESDWRDYRGSSTWLLADIDELGSHNFSFDIIATFESKSGIALGEATLILASGSLLAPECYYNRAAPGVRGSISLTDSDVEEMKHLLEWVKDYS